MATQAPEPLPAEQIDIRTTAGKLADLQRRRYEAVHAGSERAVEKQHAKGKMTARERIDALLDPGSFVEFDAFARHRSTNFGLEKNRPYSDGVVTGYGTIDGRPVAVFSQDVTVFGGSLGEVYGEKIVKVLDHALKTGCPVIGINEGGGARIQEGVVALGLYAEIFKRNTHASGVIPQISLVMGAAAGGHVYSPALTDFIVMVDQTSQMFITGPDVIKTVTGEDVTMEELGGARTHNTKSGVAHYMAADENDALEYVRTLLSYLPSNNLEDPPVEPTPVDLEVTESDLELDTFIPDSANQPYDMHQVIEHIVDDGEFLEVHELFAPNIIVGYGRVEGHPVGIVANQPMNFAGCLDIDASEKAARFVRTCDAFNVPVLTLVDVPGFLPGTDQEFNGIIRRGAKLLYAYAEATVPLVTVITRKAFGGAYDVMGSKHLGADINLAWPTAQIAVMGAQGAVNILHRRTLAAAEDVEATRAQLITEYEDTLLNPYSAAERGYVDGVIMPSETRTSVIKALRALRGKRKQLPPKKHGNIPL
ncbi:acyl-CoA carboxylase subunit beta [Thermobifida alba]|jgi:propionyl-CoA carboxylase beta chain|uniref:Acyl-CoA carboxylase subunit beta n=1 Tax=Thermobifida alba TaxID=53522 RepID=A0ABY4L281_THEAE|nr:acyl-CoA carboxylase subunit beta [Thermobifida alba]UPT21765.1 acyl-CoA carboxylase subunit beta [Thermobifida alba]HLU98777.1 acyl-CoA carboxylase subunit beta [Thermobifida alba]